MSLLLKAVIALLVLLIFVLGIIHYENKNFVVTNYKLQTDKLSGDLKMAFLSDLHNCQYGVKNERLLRAIRLENPDIVVIAGDMIVKEEESDHSATLLFLQRLVKDYPIIYANGNHEKKLEVMEDQNYSQYKKELQDSGVIFLNNESQMVSVANHKIQFTGLDLDLAYYKKLAKQPFTIENMKAILPERNKDYYEVLLAHNPVYFDTYAQRGSDLVLSGHVHGGIVILPIIGGVLSTQLTLFPKYDFGTFKKGRSTMILSRGLGSHTIKVRMFNRPELAMIKVTGTKKALDK